MASAIERTMRDEEGNLYSSYVDLATLQPIPDISGYDLISPENVPIEDVPLTDIPFDAFQTAPASPQTLSATTSGEAKRIVTGGSLDASPAPEGMNERSRTVSNDFGYIDKPGLLGMAGKLPGVLGVAGKFANAVVNAENVKAVDKARSVLGLEPTSTLGQMKGLVSDNKGVVSESTNIGGTDYGIQMGGVMPDGRTALTPNEARTRAAILDAPMAEKTKATPSPESPRGYSLQPASKTSVASPTSSLGSLGPQAPTTETGVTQGLAGKLGGVPASEIGTTPDAAFAGDEMEDISAPVGVDAAFEAEMASRMQATPNVTQSTVAPSQVQSKSTFASTPATDLGQTEGKPRGLQAVADVTKGPTATSNQGISYSHPDRGIWSAGLTPDTVDATNALAGQLNGLSVTSAGRPGAINASVGGVKNSSHITGEAIDISLAGMSDEEKSKAVENAKMAGFTGIGAYSNNNSLHLDMNPRESIERNALNKGIAYGMFDYSQANLANAPGWFTKGLTQVTAPTPADKPAIGAPPVDAPMANLESQAPSSLATAPAQTSPEGMLSGYAIGTPDTSLSASRAQAVQDAYGAAYAAGLTGPQADVSVAQAMHESAYGTKPSGINNMHGIKGPGTVVNTHEVVDGVSTPTKASFANFASPTDSFAGWGKQMDRNWSGVMSATNTDDAIGALSQGRLGAYATDPGYAGKISDMVDTTSKFSFDNAGPVSSKGLGAIGPGPEGTFAEGAAPSAVGDLSAGVTADYSGPSSFGTPGALGSNPSGYSIGPGPSATSTEASGAIGSTDSSVGESGVSASPSGGLGSPGSPGAAADGAGGVGDSSASDGSSGSASGGPGGGGLGGLSGGIGSSPGSTGASSGLGGRGVGNSPGGSTGFGGFGGGTSGGLGGSGSSSSGSGSANSGDNR